MARKTKSKSKSKRNVRPVKPVVLANNQDPRPIRAPRARRSRGGKVSTAHVRSVCSVTDPFCPAAKNAKWPDGTSGNTLTEQFRGVLNVSVDANGNGFVVFHPTVPFGMSGATITGTAPGPYTGTLNALTVTYRAASMLATYGSNYRIVSFGCIVRCVASATQAAGIVTLGTAPCPTLGQAVTLGQELYSETIVKAIQPGMESSWISTPAGTAARAFVAQTATNATQPSADWNALWLEISGATASTSPITVEYFINVEFKPLTSARALTAIAKQNPPKSTVAETAVSSVHSSLGSFIEGGIASVEQAVAKHASDALSSFMDDPLTSLSALFSM